MNGSKIEKFEDLIAWQKAQIITVYIYQNFTANLGQSLAASTIMLLSMALILIPWIRMEFGKKANG